MKVLVTGSTSGIGEAIALRFAVQGADVVVSGRDRVRGEAVAGRLADQSSGKFAFLPADLTSTGGPAALGAAADVLLGGVDVLVNNAGVYSFGPAALIGEELFDAMFSVNVRGPYLLTNSLLPGMAERGGGAVINITTAAAYRGFPGCAAYGASKAALDLLTKAWASEYGRLGVRVNAVSPGPVHTPGTSAGADALDAFAGTFVGGRAGTVEEIAAAVTFLAGPDASHIHGATLHVDGGAVAAAG